MQWSYFLNKNIKKWRMRHPAHALTIRWNIRDQPRQSNPWHMVSLRAAWAAARSKGQFRPLSLASSNRKSEGRDGAPSKIRAWQQSRLSFLISFCWFYFFSQLLNLWEKITETLINTDGIEVTIMLLLPTRNSKSPWRKRYRSCHWSTVSHEGQERGNARSRAIEKPRFNGLKY